MEDTQLRLDRAELWLEGSIPNSVQVQTKSQCDEWVGWDTKPRNSATKRNNKHLQLNFILMLLFLVFKTIQGEEYIHPNQIQLEGRSRRLDDDDEYVWGEKFKTTLPGTFKQHVCWAANTNMVVYEYINQGHIFPGWVTTSYSGWTCRATLICTQ